MNKIISFTGSKTISKGRSGKIITAGIAVSHSPDGKRLVLQPVNSRGVISPASRIEVPVEKAEVIAGQLLYVARSSGLEQQPVEATTN